MSRQSATRFLAAVVASALTGLAIVFAAGATTHGGTVLGRISNVDATAPPVPTPRPQLKPGALGPAPRVAAGRGGVVAYSGNSVRVSADGGRSWRDLAGPASGTGIAVDVSDLSVAIAGGASLKGTTDGGRTWTDPRSPPPGPGPWRALLVSPFDPTIWFFAHDGKVARTRDAGQTWKDLANLPALDDSAGMVPGAAPGQFVLYVRNQLVEFDDSGQTFKPLPPLPSGVTVRAISISGGTPGVVRGSDGKVYLQRGAGWTPAGTSLAGPVATGVNGVIAVGDGAASVDTAAGVVVSRDSGASWQTGGNLPANESLEALAALDPTATTLLAYFMGGDIYTSSDSGASWSLASSALRASS